MPASKDTVLLEVLRQAMTEIQREIAQFKAHLQSEKFQGTEEIIKPCGYHEGLKPYNISQIVKSALCRDCKVTEERKDWIATTDVLRWLDGIDTLTR